MIMFPFNIKSLQSCFFPPVSYCYIVISSIFFTHSFSLPLTPSHSPPFPPSAKTERMKIPYGCWCNPFPLLLFTLCKR